LKQPLNEGLAGGVGLALEGVLRIASYANPITAAYSILTAFGIGELIGSEGPAEPSLPELQAGYVRSVVNNGNFVAAVDRSINEVVVRYTDGSTWSFDHDNGGSILARPDGVNVYSNFMNEKVVGLPNGEYITLERGTWIDVRQGGQTLVISEAPDGAALIRGISSNRVVTATGAFIDDASAFNGKRFEPLTSESRMLGQDITVKYIWDGRDGVWDVESVLKSGVNWTLSNTMKLELGRIGGANPETVEGIIQITEDGFVKIIDQTYGTFKTYDVLGTLISTSHIIVAGDTSTEITIGTDGSIVKTVTNLADGSIINTENIERESSGSNQDAAAQATRVVVSDVASFITSLRNGDEVTQIISATRLVYDIAAINQIQGLDALGNSAYGAGSIVGIISAIKGLQSDNVLTQIGSATSLLSNASTLYDVLDGGYTFNSPNGFLSGSELNLLSQVGAIISVANLATNLDDLLENGQVSHRD